MIPGIIASKRRGAGDVGTHWSKVDKNASIVVSSDSRIFYNNDPAPGHRLIRGAQGRNVGKYYVEFSTNQQRGVEGGGLIAGLATSALPLSDVSPGEQPGSLGVAFRRYISDSDSVFGYTPGDAYPTGLIAAANFGWMGLAVNFANRVCWLIVDGVWYLNRNPSNSPSIGFASWEVSEAPWFPAASSYYTKAQQPNAEIMLRIAAEEMLIGSGAFGFGGVLESFVPWASEW